MGRTSMNEYIGKTIGGIVSPIVDVVDVDGVVQRIDVNKLVERVDINALLDRVDLDRQLQRIDFDAVFDSINIDQILEKSNLNAIIARSSTGVCSHILDIIRTQVVYTDQFIQRAGRLACCYKTVYLPPKPDRQRNQEKIHFPDSRTELAIQVQHRYCGVFSHFLAALIDFCIVVASVVVILLILEAIVGVFQDDPDVELDWYWYVIILFVWRLVYDVSLLYVFRRTVGMGMIGLLLVSSDGSPCGFFRVLFRHLLQRCIIFLIPLLLLSYLVGLTRADGRMLVDLITCSGLVYAWDARMAKLRHKPLLKSQDSEDMWDDRV